MATLEPQEPSWIRTAPIQIRETIEVDAPAQDVWDEFAADASWADWFPGFRDCRYLSEPPHGVGALRFVHQDQFKVSEKIISWEPGACWGMTVVEINAPIIAAMAEEATFTEHQGRTTVDFRIGVELRGIGRILRRPLVAKSTKALATGLANLATRLDAGA